MRLSILASLACLGILILGCTKNNSLTTPDVSATSSLTLRDTVEVGTLPAAILDYIAVNYPNSTISLAESGTEDNGAVIYEVTLSSGEALVFDEAGIFLGLDDHNGNENENENEGDDQHGNDSENGQEDHHGQGEDNGHDLTLDQLPQLIQDFLAANYAGLTFEEAEQDTLCDGTATFLIQLQDANQQALELVIGLNGQLLYTVTTISLADLPSAIKDAVAAAYPNHTLEDDADLLTSPNGAVQYQLELEPATNAGQETDLMVLLATDGSILCEQTE